MTLKWEPEIPRLITIFVISSFFLTVFPNALAKILSLLNLFGVMFKKKKIFEKWRSFHLRGGLTLHNFSKYFPSTQNI